AGELARRSGARFVRVGCGVGHRGIPGPGGDAYSEGQTGSDEAEDALGTRAWLVRVSNGTILLRHLRLRVLVTWSCGVCVKGPIDTIYNVFITLSDLGSSRHPQPGIISDRSRAQLGTLSGERARLGRVKAFSSPRRVFEYGNP